MRGFEAGEFESLRARHRTFLTDKSANALKGKVRSNARSNNSLTAWPKWAKSNKIALTPHLAT